MLIAVYDSNEKDLKYLEEMLKQALPNHQIESFTLKYQLRKFVESNDVAIVFLDKEKGKSGYDYRLLVFALREISPWIDFVMVSEEAIDNPAALWLLKNHGSDYLQKPVQYEKLTEALKYIKKHRIPEYDL